MLFDIEYNGYSGSWRYKGEEIACKKATDIGFPDRFFTIRVEANKFEGSTQVEFMFEEYEEVDGNPIFVDGVVIDDHYLLVDRLVTSNGLMDENKCFFFKVVS